MVTPRATELPLNGPLSPSKVFQKIFPVSLGGCYGVSRENDRCEKRTHISSEFPSRWLRKFSKCRNPWPNATAIASW